MQHYTPKPTGARLLHRCLGLSTLPIPLLYTRSQHNALSSTVAIIAKSVFRITDSLFMPRTSTDLRPYAVHRLVRPFNTLPSFLFQVKEGPSRIPVYNLSVVIVIRGRRSSVLDFAGTWMRLFGSRHEYCSFQKG